MRFVLICQHARVRDHAHDRENVFYRDYAQNYDRGYVPARQRGCGRKLVLFHANVYGYVYISKEWCENAHVACFYANVEGKSEARPNNQSQLKGNL